MIAKHIPMRSAQRTSFSRLVEYITDEQSRTERIVNIQATNCEADTLEAVIQEIAATQHQNTRVTSDKTFHLLVSFRAGEQPSGDTLEEIEKRLCAGLGYSDHQRVSATHSDTDNLHIHIAINKIHPERLTLHDPFQSYRTLGGLCQVLEREYNLEQDNHHNNRKHTRSEIQIEDMERNTGIESLASWIKRTCLPEIREAQSWSDLHQVMHANDLVLRKQANGFVIESGDGTQVKASTVARDLSKPKLEKRLGTFEPSTRQQAKIEHHNEYKREPIQSRVNTAELYAAYQEDQRTLTVIRDEALKKAKWSRGRELEAARRSNKMQRSAIKLMGSSALAKKFLYNQAHKALHRRTQAIDEQYKRTRTALYAQNKRRAWVDWLRQRAQAGDQRALKALRAREAAQGLKGDTIRGEGTTSASPTVEIDTITKKGTILFRAGECAVRDDGKRLQVLRATVPAVEKTLRIALQRYGGRIAVAGTAQFKAQAIQAAVAAKLPITFIDPSLEQRRHLLSGKNPHERLGQQHLRTERGRTDRRGAGRTGPRTAPSQSAAASFNPAGIGPIPPPQRRHCLRTLSDVAVVRHTAGTEVLLSSHVPHHMEQPRAESDYQLRWGALRAGPRPGVTGEPVRETRSVKKGRSNQR